MLEVSTGCIGQDTYGVSCTFCGECGRKWTSHGVDDSEVVRARRGINTNSYKEAKKLLAILNQERS